MAVFFKIDISRDMKKIMQVIWGLGGGGKERRLIQLVNGLYEAGGYDQTLVSMSAKNDYKGKFEDHVDYIVIDSGSKWARCKALMKVIKEKKPDIVHLWDNTPAWVLFLPYLKRRYKFKYVAGFVTEAHPLKRFSSQSFTTWLAFTCADAIVSNSKACLASKRANPKQSHVIYNGFDFARFDAPGFDRNEYRKSLGIDESHFVATMVARFTPNKDYTMLVEFAEKLKDITNLVFLAIGKGETLEHTQQLCKEKGVENIKFLGFRSDVEKILMCSEVGLLFTNDKVHAEGISNSILESMAAGLPVIATNGGGTPEIIENGKSGFIVEPCDSEAAAKQLRELYTNDKLREEIGNNAKARIVEQFTLDSMTKKYIDFYNKL